MTTEATRAIPASGRVYRALGPALYSTSIFAEQMS